MITLLIGHRGVGKTSLMKRLEVIFSDREDMIFKDLDNEIEILNRKSITSIFQREGESEFRRLETSTFQTLVESVGKRDVVIAVGAGFEFPIPEGVRCIWVRRMSDVAGRVMVNRPRLSDVSPMQEWRKRFDARDRRYRILASEQLMLPEGGSHDKVLEEHFFGLKVRQIPFHVTALPQHFHGADYWRKRMAWGMNLELRDDLLTPNQIQTIRKIWPDEGLLLSLRKPETSQKPANTENIDWPFEWGTPPFPVRVISLHERLPRLQDTMRKFTVKARCLLKLAVEIHSFEELLEGHRWWQAAPEKRVFLPRSKDGRWQWYRQLFGPQMKLHFFREGDGTADDQPFLWQTLTTPRTFDRFAAILGSPVTQSWTPTFQREFFDPAGIPVVSIRVDEQEWPNALPVLQKLGLHFAAVTSPLKKLAFRAAQKHSAEARRFSSVNTLAWTGTEWSGHNTDLAGARALFHLEFRDPKIPVVVWGGGGTKEILRELLPKARFVSARKGETCSDPYYLVWATGRNREFVWPEKPALAKEIVDLNYGEDSPAREVALKVDCPYKSGETMFIQQGLQQREFWKRFL